MVTPEYFPQHPHLPSSPSITDLHRHLFPCPDRTWTVSDTTKFLDFLGCFVYDGASIKDAIFFKEECAVIKVNQEELQVKIKKLKQTAAEKAAKAGGKKSDPEARKARKKVKRVQRKLRSAKAYKSAGKKASAAAPAEGKATA